MKRLLSLFALLVMAAVSVSAQDQPAEEKFNPSKNIRAVLTSLSLEKYGPMKEDKTFKAGETVFINLELKGLKANEENKVVVQADLVVPQLSLDRKNLVDGSTDYEEAVPMYFQIPIGSVQQGGICNAKITIRDMVAKTFIVYNVQFKLAK